MALHPTGHAVIHNASTGAANTRSIAVHTLALMAQPLLLAGTLAVTARLRALRPLAIGAFVFYAFASLAAIIAAVASGFLAPSVLRGLAGADNASRAVMMSALRYTGLLNEAFARVYVMFSSMAILLWSVAMFPRREFTRALAVYGVVIGVAAFAGIVTGYLRLDVHGFGLVVFVQGTWVTWMAVQLWTIPETGRHTAA